MRVLNHEVVLPFPPSHPRFWRSSSRTPFATQNKMMTARRLHAAEAAPDSRVGDVLSRYSLGLERDPERNAQLETAEHECADAVAGARGAEQMKRVLFRSPAAKLAAQQNCLPRGQQDPTIKELMAARRLEFVRGRSERSVTLDAVLADLRQLSPEALTRCADVIRALAQAESVVQKARADQTRPAVSRAVLGARCAGDAAHRPLTIPGDRHRATVASRRSVDSGRRQSRRPYRPDRR